VIAEAMRSMAEWAASESIPSEPVSRPVSSLSSATRAAAATEKIAAARWRREGMVRAENATCVGAYRDAMGEMLQGSNGLRAWFVARATWFARALLQCFIAR